MLCVCKSEQPLPKTYPEKVLLFLQILFTVVLPACSTRNNSGIITYQVTKSDFIETINVTGTVQAVVNYPVMPPKRMWGQMTIIRLAADGSYVRKGDTICVLTLPELQSMHEEVATSVETLEAELKKTEADNKLNTALLEAQLATSEAQLKMASLDSLRMQFASVNEKKLLELEIKKAVIEKQKTEKKLASTKVIGEKDIRSKKARILQEQARVQSMAEQLNSMTIVAQRDGFVTRTESPKFYFMGPQGLGSLGGPIKEGSVLFLDNPVLQFPDLSKMQISAEVAEADYKKIEKGQKVTVIVDAAEKLATTGKVNRKGLIGKTSDRYSDIKVKFYEIIIEIDSCHSKIKPGLSAHCEIILNQAKDTLFVPTLALFERDSIQVVYVLKKKNFIPVKVETAASGSSYTIITGGLNGDEVIALSEPPNSLISEEKVKVEKIDSAKIKKTRLNPAQ
jgi:HlyD family secretion protein